MSYQIQYNPDFWKDRPQKKTERLNGKFLNIWGIILCVAALAVAFQYRDAIKDYLIPGDCAVTTAAVNHLCEKLKDGEPIKEALMEFCFELCDNEQLY